MASSQHLASVIYDAEYTAKQVKDDEGGSRYLSLVSTHLELARFYAEQRIKENLSVPRT